MSILSSVIGKDADFIDEEGNTTLGSSHRLRLNPVVKLFLLTPLQAFNNFTQFMYNSQHQSSGLEAHAYGLHHDEQFYVPQSYVP